jgi:small subunit ribosomal protein S21e
MQNEFKEYVDSYIPRKCFATNKILNAKDKGSVQINFSDVSYIKYNH